MTKKFMPQLKISPSHDIRSARISRAQFIRLLGIGGGGAALTVLTTGAAPRAAAPLIAASEMPTSGPTPVSPSATPEAGPAQFEKSTRPFLKVSATGLGTQWYKQTSFVTPINNFFVSNRYKTPVVDAGTWKLKVTGDAIANPMEFTYDDLLKLPNKQTIHYIECFGNGRTVNREQLGFTVQGEDWGFSAASQGEWVYVPIHEILERVKPTQEANHVLFWSGVDGLDTGRPMSLADINARPDTIGLAYGMNGGALLPDHGGPVRVLVPGWGGAASVKWLTEIRISSHRFWTRMGTGEGALIGNDYYVEQPGPNDEFLNVGANDIRGMMATWQNTKSWLTVPYVYRISDPPAGYTLKKGEIPKLAAGAHTMRGYSTSPRGIKRVEYRIDNGDWQEARLVPPLDLEYAWARFEFPWDATAGKHTIRTRATDKFDVTQPENVPLNEFGIRCNAIPRFEMKVV